MNFVKGLFEGLVGLIYLAWLYFSGRAEHLAHEEIDGGLKGYWADTLSIDKRLIEAKKCPKCRKPLEYRGFSKLTEYKAFGVCESCKYTKHFWTEPTESAEFKKSICRAVKSKKSSAGKAAA